MKRIFTLLAVAMMAITAFAQGDVKTYTLNGGKDVSNPVGFFTHGDKFNFNAKFKDAEYDGISFSNGLKMEGATTIMFTSTVKGDLIIVQSTWSANTIKLDGTELSVDDAEAGTGCRIYSIPGLEAGEHTIGRGSGESGLFYIKLTYTEADNTPSLAISPKNIKLFCMPGATESSATITVTGKNLPDGTYPFTQPNLAGLAFDPAAITVSGGEVEQEVTVYYSSTDDVALGTEPISLDINGTIATVNLTYSSRSTLIEQKAVSEAKVWDWTQLTETVELGDATMPFTKNDTFVLANLDNQIKFPEDFDAACIKLTNTVYPSRSKKFQNGTIGILTTVDGVLSVNFSDTGSTVGDNDVERYLAINGSVDLIIDGQSGTQRVYSKRDGSSDPKEVTDIAVKAGDITINGAQLSDDGSQSDTPIVVTKVTFTPKDINQGMVPTGIVEVAAQTTSTDAIYNLAGQKVNAQYKGVVVKNGQKLLQK